MMMRSGVRAPDASPSRIMRAAAVLTEPPGFCHSALAHNSTGRFTFETVEPHRRVRPTGQCEVPTRSVLTRRTTT